MWLRSSAINDIQPSYLRKIYEDVPRSWTLMLTEEADQHNFNENLTASVIHACRSWAFLEKGQEQYWEAWSQLATSSK